MPDTNEDNYESNYITISVGMTDKQVVWFMGFFSTSIFPRRIVSSTANMNLLDLTPLSCVICVLLTFACLAQAALRRHIDKNAIPGQLDADVEILLSVKAQLLHLGLCG